MTALALCMVMGLTSARCERALVDLDSDVFLARQRGTNWLQENGQPFLFLICLAADEPCSLERKLRLERIAACLYGRISDRIGQWWLNKYDQEGQCVDFLCGPAPCADSVRYDVAHAQYIPYSMLPDEGLSLYRPVDMRRLLYVQQWRGKTYWENERALTKVFLCEELEKGTPLCVVWIALAELRRRDEAYFSRGFRR